MKFVSFLFATVLSISLLATGLPVNDNNDGKDVQRRDCKVKRQCFPNGSFYDDAGYKVPLEYIGAWTHLSNQGSTVKSGTLSYTGQANA